MKIHPPLNFHNPQFGKISLSSTQKQVPTSEKGKALTTPLPLSLPRVARRQLNARSASTLKKVFFIGSAANIVIYCKSCGFFYRAIEDDTFPQGWPPAKMIKTPAQGTMSIVVVQFVDFIMVTIVLRHHN